MSKIFISYRREDSAPWAGRIYERLARDFMRDQLFMDVDDIPPGSDFVKVLDEKVANCDVMLVIIGANWLTVKDTSGQPRLDNPNDFVRIEIESALNRGKTVIPLLVGLTQMPQANVLPTSMSGLAHQNAMTLTHEKFGVDTLFLVKALKDALSKGQQTSPNFGLWFLKGCGTLGSFLLGIVSTLFLGVFPVGFAMDDNGLIGQMGAGLGALIFLLIPASLYFRTQSAVLTRYDFNFMLGAAATGLSLAIWCTMLAIFGEKETEYYAGFAGMSSVFFLIGAIVLFLYVRYRPPQNAENW